MLCSQAAHSDSEYLFPLSLPSTQYLACFFQSLLHRGEKNIRDSKRMHTRASMLRLNALRYLFLALCGSLCIRITHTHKFSTHIFELQKPKEAVHFDSFACKHKSTHRTPPFSLSVCLCAQQFINEWAFSTRYFVYSQLQTKME